MSTDKKTTIQLDLTEREAANICHALADWFVTYELTEAEEEDVYSIINACNAIGLEPNYE